MHAWHVRLRFIHLSPTFALSTYSSVLRKHSIFLLLWAVGMGEMEGRFLLIFSDAFSSMPPFMEERKYRYIYAEGKLMAAAHCSSGWHSIVDDAICGIRRRKGGCQLRDAHCVDLHAHLLSLLWRTAAARPRPFGTCDSSLISAPLVWWHHAEDWQSLESEGFFIGS